MQLLEVHLGQLWDHVWWRHLPWYRRLFYWLKGFRDPIKVRDHPLIRAHQFYEDVED